jgi:hypothetical protein
MNPKYGERLGGTSIFISGVDVSAIGYESNGTKDVAKLWKNGVATNLSDATKDAGADVVFVK